MSQLCWHGGPAAGGDNGSLLPTDAPAGKTYFARLAWDDAQKQLAFRSDGDLYVWNRSDERAKAAVKAPEGRIVSDRAGLDFSGDGSKLFYSIGGKSAEKPEPDLAIEKPLFELWHFKDDRVQTIQKVRAEQERNRSYRHVLHIPAGKTVALGSTELPEITPSEQGDIAIGIDDRSYRAASEYDNRYSDAYLVDAATGERRLVVRRTTTPLVLSPDGKSAAYFQSGDWWLLDTGSATSTNLTGGLKQSGAAVKFRNELGCTTPELQTMRGGLFLWLVLRLNMP